MGTIAEVIAFTWILHLVESERTRRVYGRRPTEAAYIQVYERVGVREGI